MGEIADMMLDGTFCQVCGGVMGDVDENFVAPGYPRTCGGCKREDRTWRKRKPKKKAP